MGTLASALIALGTIKYSDDLIYVHVHYKSLSTTLGFQSMYSLFSMSMSTQFFLQNLVHNFQFYIHVFSVFYVHVHNFCFLCRNVLASFFYYKPLD